MMNPNKAGLVLGMIFGGWHFIWSLLVLSGYAQKIYDFILWAHMIHLSIVIGPFEMQAAGMLILITTFIGYIFGFTAAWAWNQVHQSKTS